MLAEIDILRPLGNVPITTATLKSVLSNYRHPNVKIKHWIDDGMLIPLKRGLYIVSPKITMQEPCLELMANHIYVPSYVSQHYALRRYGLIPEQTNRLTSVTTNHTRSFENSLGHFAYTGVSRSYFAIGVTSRTENNCSYLIATPEKALVDTILVSPYISSSLIGLERFLEDDLRLDTDVLKDLNIPILQACLNVAPKQTILQNLITLCQL